MTHSNLTPKQAHKRYLGRMLGASFGYVGSVFGASYFIDSGDPITPITILVALVPAAFVLMMLAAVWRYIAEVDEVARHYSIQSMMVALFGVLALSGSWGLVELFNEDLPRLPVFWLFPTFFALFGLAGAIGFRRCV
ncbi:MAG: hypothetical protein WBF53_07025 [Litorimonas sp.]